MPNHVTNEIALPAEHLPLLVRTRTAEELLEHERAEDERERRFAESGRSDRFHRQVLDPAERIIDFAILIPQPANIERGGCDGTHDEGVVCWYTWNMLNWGTKWNGYDLDLIEHDDGTVTVRFNTAWSHPEPVIARLSRRLPELELRVRFADEDLGYNLGKYTIRDGEVVDRHGIREGSDAALDFAARMRYGRSYAELQAEWAEYDDDDEPATAEPAGTTQS